MRCEKALPATSLLLGCEVGQDKAEQDMGTLGLGGFNHCTPANCRSLIAAQWGGDCAVRLALGAAARGRI